MRIALAAIGMLVAPAGWAQDSAPDIAIAAAMNQQGLLEYCAAQGHIGAEAAQTQARVIASFPPPQNAALAAEAYRKGQAGTLSAMEIEQPLADAAAGQGATPAALCAELAATAERAAGQLPE